MQTYTLKSGEVLSLKIEIGNQLLQDLHYDGTAQFFLLEQEGPLQLGPQVDNTVKVTPIPGENAFTVDIVIDSIIQAGYYALVALSISGSDQGGYDYKAGLTNGDPLLSSIRLHLTPSSGISGPREPSSITSLTVLKPQSDK